MNDKDDKELSGLPFPISWSPVAKEDDRHHTPLSYGPFEDFIMLATYKKITLFIKIIKLKFYKILKIKPKSAQTEWF